MKGEQKRRITERDAKLLDVALDDLPCGLSIWRTDFTLALWNRQFLAIYGLAPDDVAEGVSLDTITERIVAAGSHADKSGPELFRIYRDRMLAHRKRSTISVDERLSDRRVINIKRTRVPGLGWVILHEDVTEARNHESELERSNKRLDAAISNMAEGLCVFDDESRLVTCNDLYAELYDLPPRLVEPGTPHQDIAAYRIEHGMEPFEHGADFLQRHRVLLSQAKAATEVVQLRNGRIIMIRHQPLRIGGWVATHLDITDQKAHEQELENQNVRFDAAINNMRQGLCMFDGSRKLIVSNRLYAEMYHISPESIRPGMSLEEILALRLAHGNESVTGDETYVRRRLELVDNGADATDIVELLDGRIISILHHPMKDGGWVSTHHDITDERRNEDRIRHLARHDALTDLPNRTYFHERVHELQPLIARGRRAAVLSIDLDHFKEVNDTLGHAAGDNVLKEGSARMIACCRETDMVARLGGDEFAILQTPIDAPDDAAALAVRIIKAIAEPFDVLDHRFLIGASIGIAIAPVDGADADTLVKHADLALYRSKNEGRSAFHFYESGMDAALQRRRAVDAGLRRALARSELTLAFQPLINIAENRVHALEALLRWSDQDGHAVGPEEFIPIAEETGLIVPIGEWVLREACAAAANWPDQVSVAVNLSPVQFKNPGLVEQVKAALAASGLSPRRLELEVTESVLMANNKLNLTILQQLHELGAKICMDDFGTGYSSLSYLRSFPFDKIKIDQSFVRDSSTSDDARAIVEAVIGLGRSLGMATTAEGVETEAQLDLVRDQGCTEAQGFLFSAPLPLNAVNELLARLEPVPPAAIEAAS